MTEDWAEELLGFWFSLAKDQWWTADPQLDEEIRRRFLELWEEKRKLTVDSFLGSPREALAAVILFDQLPRNMFRGHADQFSTDHLALAIARDALDRQFDQKLAPAERQFLYMPFQHSEQLDDQRRSLLLFTQLGDEEQLEYARKHYEVIERFGRFPHRNEVLGRAPRPEEIAAGNVVPW